MRLKRGETDSATGRSLERYRRASLSTIVALLSKLVSLTSSIVTVRLTARYLGIERYGMWMTISSFVLMLNSADLGMSNGLITVIADATGRGYKKKAFEASATAFWLLSAIGCSVLLIAFCAYPFTPWAKLFNVHSALARKEAGPALLLFVACCAANLPLGTVYGVQNGLQNGFVNGLWGTVGQLASLSATVWAIHENAGLPLLMLAMLGVPIVASVGNAIQLFFFDEPNLVPKFSGFSTRMASELLGMGTMFFLLQLSLSIAYQSDNVVIAQVLGAQAVPSYAVPARLFGMVTGMLTMLSGPLWPAYAEALARSDGAWIRKTFYRMAIAGFAVASIVTIIFVRFGNSLLKVWVGPEFHASLLLLSLFGARCALSAYLQPINFLLNGLNRLKTPVALSLGMAILNLALSILLVRRIGIIGAVIGTIIAETFVLVIPLTIIATSALKALEMLPEAEPSSAK